MGPRVTHSLSRWGQQAQEEWEGHWAVPNLLSACTL